LMQLHCEVPNQVCSCNPSGRQHSSLPQVCGSESCLIRAHLYIMHRLEDRIAALSASSLS
jgi:hypothetical protein